MYVLIVQRANNILADPAAASLENYMLYDCNNRGRIMEWMVNKNKYHFRSNDIRMNNVGIYIQYYTVLGKL